MKRLDTLYYRITKKKVLTHHYYQVYPIPICLAELKSQSCRPYHPGFLKKTKTVHEIIPNLSYRKTELTKVTDFV